MKQLRKICVFMLFLALVCGGMVPAVRAETCDHEYVEQEAPATCTENGMRFYGCAECGDSYGYESIPPLGHLYGQWEMVTEASCGKPGEESRGCERCGYMEVREIPALEHSYTAALVAPTCTKDGYTLLTCDHCGDTEKQDPTPKTGHHYDGGVVTKEPTTTAMGRITYTCASCGDSYTETTPKLVNPFEDVKQSAYYFNAVLWAVDRGVTSGTDETHFSPDARCTRAQVVTFLWRAMGSPEPSGTDCPFVDVPEKSYYRTAVLWAREQGITAGVDATHFGSGQFCTRAQVMTFLYRAKGSPEWNGDSRFSDVKESDYFFRSVGWAADNGITSGVDGERFGSHQTCTRAQIVTFLYKADTLG